MTYRNRLSEEQLFRKGSYFMPEPTIGRLRQIAEELEEIKELVNQIETKEQHQINREELDEIENRLNLLEFGLFYDSLN